jgi:hypothetical protein
MNMDFSINKRTSLYYHHNKNDIEGLNYHLPSSHLMKAYNLINHGY